MSLTRRLAAGLPAAGATIFAALALSGAPASAATEDLSAQAAQPVAMATPCVGNARECPAGYGTHAVGPAVTATATTDDHRGNPGYGGESPATTPPTTPPTTPSRGPDTVPPTYVPDTVPPTYVPDTVPPGGVSPTTVPPGVPPGGGVSPAGILPVTGAPGIATAGVGAALVGAGFFAVWYSRRRRES